MLQSCDILKNLGIQIIHTQGYTQTPIIEFNSFLLQNTKQIKLKLIFKTKLHQVVK